MVTDRPHPASDDPGSGVLVIRVWVENHPDHPLRAVITRWSVKGMTSSAAASISEVSSEVEAWLRQLLAER